MGSSDDDGGTRRLVLHTAQLAPEERNVIWANVMIDPISGPEISWCEGTPEEHRECAQALEAAWRAQRAGDDPQAVARHEWFRRKTDSGERRGRRRRRGMAALGDTGT